MEWGSFGLPLIHLLQSRSFATVTFYNLSHYFLIRSCHQLPFYFPMASQAPTETGSPVLVNLSTEDADFGDAFDCGHRYLEDIGE